MALAVLATSFSLHWLLSRATPETPTGLASGPASASPSSNSSSAPHPLSPSPHLSPIFTPEVRRWESDILRWGDEYGLDPNLIATLMQIESCGHPQIRSSAGAVGLFQVMPYHFRPHEDPTDPNTNAKRGLGYFRRALRRAKGDLGRAFAGYNGGHGVINLQPRAWSAETRRFFSWATGIMGDIDAGSETSPTLRAWLKAGGRSLCRKAATRLASLP